MLWRKMKQGREMETTERTEILNRKCHQEDLEEICIWDEGTLPTSGTIFLRRHWDPDSKPYRQDEGLNSLSEACSLQQAMDLR